MRSNLGSLKTQLVLPRFELGLLDSKSRVLPLHHKTSNNEVVLFVNTFFDTTFMPPTARFQHKLRNKKI